MDIDLSKVIGYSRDSLQSRTLMRSIMLDLYPGKTREMNVLLDVYESGVPRKIKNDGNITDAKYAQYIQKIVDDYGMQEQWAVVGLNAWIDVCLGKGTAATIKYRVVTVPSNGGNASNGNTVGGGYTNPIVHNNSAPVNNTPVQGNASDYEIADLGNGTIEIKKFVGFDQADTIIPTDIDGKKVVGIGVGAFQQCKGIKQLIIPEGIEYVEDGAFADCSNLIRIVLPNTLSRIGNQNSRNFGLGHKGAFQGTAISEIDLPNQIKIIPRSCFSNCKQLRKVQFPDNLEEISTSAFWLNEKLTDIQLPSTVKKIGSNAFYGCTALLIVNLNEGLKIIDGGAFENCSAITEITIPSTVETFGSDIFKCGYGGNKNILIKCYQGSRAIEYVRKNNHRLGSVTPSAQRNNGLSFADALQKVNPIKHNNFNASSAPAIGNTSDYEIADLGNGTIEIKKFVGFDQAETVIPIEINGKKVVGIGNGAFQQCKGIKQLIIPEGIEYVEDGAFADCSNLMKIILPSTLRRLGSQNSRSIGIGHKGVFQGTAISEIDLPNQIKVIPRSCFSNCKQLRKVQFPDTLEEISSSSFWVNEKLIDIQLPPTVKKIGSNAFYGCTMLSNVKLNEGLLAIEGGVFENCSAIIEITIPSTVETFGSDIFKCGYGGNKNIVVKCYPGSRAIEYIRKNNLRVEKA